MVTIHAYRHPAIANPEGLCYGRYDIPLAADWQQQLASTPPSARSKKTVRCYSSPATRALTYAFWLWPSCTICVEPRLQELDFGVWEGRPWTAIAHEEVNHWQRDLWRHSAPEGESVKAMSQRLDDFLAALTAEMAEKEQAVQLVTHHGVLKLMIAKAKGLSLDELMAVSVPFGQKVSFRLSSHDQSREDHTLALV